MTGDGMCLQHGAPGSSSGAAGAPTPYTSTTGQTPYSSGEPAFSPADATTMGAGRPSAGAASVMSDADFRDSASRDAATRDPS
jgi:hypothetical protein